MDSVPSGNLPIYEMLFSFFKKEEVSFHMPGHSRGKSFSSEFFENFPSLDTTELESTDDLNNPTGPVKKAMALAKDAFGSEKTFFVTTGSTTALHAALLSCTAQGDKIIVFRDAHKSIVNACCLYNLKVIFTSSITFANVLKNHPDAACAVITRPDYYGICHDISEIIKDLHTLSIPVIVDEAHGTHLHFCPELFPPDALSLGADIVVQSAHKTTPALTPGSFLHVNSSFRAKDPRDVVHRDIQYNISRVSTSSPSFLITASLDYARYYLSEFGNIKYKELFKNILLFYLALSLEVKDSLPSHIVRFLEKPSVNNRTFDFTRISLFTKYLPISPSELASELAKRGIFIEFFDVEKIVLICKPDTTLDDLMLLAKHLNEISKNSLMHFYFNKDIEKVRRPDDFDKTDNSEDFDEFNNSEDFKKIEYELEMHKLCWHCFAEDLKDFHNHPPEIVYDFGKIESDLRKANSYTYVPLEKAEGRISADCLVPYPPGIPLIFPGDEITEYILDYLHDLMKYNITVNGVVAGNELSLTDTTKYIKVFV